MLVFRFNLVLFITVELTDGGKKKEERSIRLTLEYLWI